MAKRRNTVHSQRRRQAVFGSILVLGLIVSLALVAQSRIDWDGQSDAETQSGARTGTIVVQTDDGQCAVAKFDNDTGRAVEMAKDCKKNAVLDARGLPMPAGTAHRLNSISRSFLGDNH